MKVCTQVWKFVPRYESLYPGMKSNVSYLSTKFYTRVSEWEPISGLWNGIHYKLLTSDCTTLDQNQVITIEWIRKNNPICFCLEKWKLWEKQYMQHFLVSACQNEVEGVGELNSKQIRMAWPDGALCRVHKRILWMALPILKVFENGSSTGMPDFSLVKDTKTGNNVPNEHKMYQMVIKCPKCS
jgi:hypothetical protein